MPSTGSDVHADTNGWDAVNRDNAIIDTRISLLTKQGKMTESGVNAFGGATTTALNNILQGKNDSVVSAGITSGALSAVGYSTGKVAESWINSSLRPTISNANG